MKKLLTISALAYTLHAAFCGPVLAQAIEPFRQ